MDAPPEIEVPREADLSSKRSSTMRSAVDLSKFENSWYEPGRGLIVRSMWFVVSLLVFQSGLPFGSLKVAVLRWFGARVGREVVIKPSVTIKYPWRLSVGDNAWIGEKSWIDNLGEVCIGANCCVSKGALLLCGNHDYKDPGFGLIVGDIVIGAGAWGGARAVVCGGVTCGDHSVLAVGSIASKDLPPFTICRGNPAEPIRYRDLRADAVRQPTQS